MSQTHTAIFRQGLLLCLVSPAGAGKSTLCRRLLEEASGIERSISLTSRAPRAGECEGIHYNFVSRSQFETRVSQGLLFEWEETHGNLYGTQRATMERAGAAGIDLLFDIDIRGALRLKESFPAQTVIVFLTAPSVKILEDRIRARGSVSEDEIRVRMESARREFATFLEKSTARQSPGSIDYLIINDDLETAYQQLRSMLVAERARIARIDPGWLKKICNGG